MAEVKCACGLPLHYGDPHIQRAVQHEVDRHGPDIQVHLSDGSIYLVQRHYIALHGLKAVELPFMNFPRLHFPWPRG